MFYIGLQDWWGPKSYTAGLLYGDCPICHHLKWSSSNDESGSLKVTYFHGLVGLGLGDGVCLPFESLWQSPPAGVLVHLWFHPCDLLHRWSQLWECQQSHCFILVADQLNLSIFSYSRWVATCACWWASLASASLQSYESSSQGLLWGISSQWWGRRALVGLHSWPTSGTSSPLLHWRWSSMEDKMSQVSSCTHSGLHSKGPGSLLNR